MSLEEEAEIREVFLGDLAAMKLLTLMIADNLNNVKRSAFQIVDVTLMIADKITNRHK